MARAKKTSARVQKYVREDRFTLTLTEGEADFILGILANIGGHPTRSPRKYADRILKALESVLGYTSTATDAAKLANGDIRFDNYSSLPSDELLQLLAQKLQRPVTRIPPRPGTREWYGERYNPNA